MSRYEDAPKWMQKLVASVRAQHFPALREANIKVVMDAQKRKARGRYVLGSLKLASSMVNYLAEQELHYLLVLDKTTFERMEDADRLALLFHLLCYAWQDVEDEETTYKLAPADFSVFAKEMELNPDWQAWNLRMNSFAAECHESKTPPEVNDPNAPRLPLGSPAGQDSAPAGEAQEKRPELEYPECNRLDLRAEHCIGGDCGESEDCNGCCWDCLHQKTTAGPRPEGECAHSAGKAGATSQDRRRP